MTEHALLDVRLETGRTHQIRVHLAAVGLPVSGDAQYGVRGDLGLERQFLHAHRLRFRHPLSGERDRRRVAASLRPRSALERAQPGERELGRLHSPGVLDHHPAIQPRRGCRVCERGSARPAGEPPVKPPERG